MTEQFSEINSLFFVLAALSYLLLLRHIDKQAVRPRPLNDYEFLYMLSRHKGCSEYDIFFQSAQDWRLSNQKIKNDFKDYLLEGRIPYYTQSYIRRMRESGENNHRPPFIFSGGGSLPWLK